MVFSSPVFLFLFLPVVLAFHTLAPRRARNAFLLLMSLAFYAWGEGTLVCLMIASVSANFAFGRAVDRAAGTPAARRWLVFAVAFNLTLLVAYKYANFLADNWNALGLFQVELGPIHLPIGISFFTFQALSYVIDVYRRDVEVERKPLDLALYVSLFPQLIAGPIVRYRDVRDKIHARTLGRERFAEGIRRFVLGLGKKVLIANTLAVPADAIFAIPGGELTAPLAWLGIVCYALQIYFDFSGYSDMAIGLGHMLGFKFLENFRYPYAARTVTDFWRRWHISLSTWFRDYLYIPLGGNRRGAARTFLNLGIVFVLCGLWHGASWNFVIWGLAHGAFLVAERAGLGAWFARRPAFVGHAWTLLAVLLAWVPFRAATLADTGTFLAAMAGLGAGTGITFHVAMFVNPLVLTALLAGIVGSTPWLTRLEGRPWPLLRVATIAAILVACAVHLSADTHNPFIYFRF